MTRQLPMSICTRNYFKHNKLCDFAFSRLQKSHLPEWPMYLNVESLKTRTHRARRTADDKFGLR